MRAIMQAALRSIAACRISGADARRFLHGLLTADIETMSEAAPR
jgi:folate-binding Fe-S cluster repair protein YgfZ